MRILVVDDDERIRYLVSSRMESLGYQVTTAQDGSEALELIQRVQPEIMILDVTMPRLDGYGVLQELRRRETNHHVYVLMLTAESTLDDVERGFGSGADDYLAKPFSLRELAARVAAGARIQSLQHELLDKNHQLHDANDALAWSLREQEALNQRIMRDMEVAARLQTSLLSPANLQLGRFVVSAQYVPTMKVGGDFYDVRRLPNNRASILLADAMGHGVSAALLAAMVKIALEEALRSQTRPAAVLTELNRTFQFCAEQGRYVTAFYGLLDCETGDLTYSIAGHVPPLLCRGSGNAIERLHSAGMCLGIFPDGQYEDQTTQLRPGDRLFIFTDGLSEASPDEGRLFGNQLPDLLRETRQLPNDHFLSRLASGLQDFLRFERLADDYALLALHFPREQSETLEQRKVRA